MEFKGTKWSLGGISGRMIKTNQYSGFVADVDTKANALLISKAPEILERLYQQNIDLKIMAANVKQLEGSVWILEGISALIQKWISENETLIKQATEL